MRPRQNWWGWDWDDSAENQEVECRPGYSARKWHQNINARPRQHFCCIGARFLPRDVHQWLPDPGTQEVAVEIALQLCIQAEIYLIPVCTSVWWRPSLIQITPISEFIHYSLSIFRKRTDISWNLVAIMYTSWHIQDTWSHETTTRQVVTNYSQLGRIRWDTSYNAIIVEPSESVIL